MTETMGSSGEISSDMTRFGHHTTFGGFSASQGSAAAARAIHSSTSRSTAKLQPSSSVCCGKQSTATVTVHSAGYVTAHSPARIMVARMSGRESRGCVRSERFAHSSRSRRIASITTWAFSMALTAPPSRQCGWKTSAWPGRPGTMISA
jgi:hypothetical protein